MTALRTAGACEAFEKLETQSRCRHCGWELREHPVFVVDFFDEEGNREATHTLFISAVQANEYIRDWFPTRPAQVRRRAW